MQRKERKEGKEGKGQRKREREEGREGGEGRRQHSILNISSCPTENSGRRVCVSDCEKDFASVCLGREIFPALGASTFPQVPGLVIYYGIQKAQILHHSVQTRRGRLVGCVHVISILFCRTHCMNYGLQCLPCRGGPARN